jgi:hypothetical protein
MGTILAYFVVMMLACSATVVVISIGVVLFQNYQDAKRTEKYGRDF